MEHSSRVQQSAQEPPPVELVEYEVPVLHGQDTRLDIATHYNRAYERSDGFSFQANPAYGQRHVSLQ